MPGQVLPYRVQGLWKTTANWAADVASSNPTIPLINEFVGEQIEDGTVKFKQGDGVNNWSGLTYTTASGNGAYLGVASTSTMPPIPTGNAFYLSATPGNYVNFNTGSGYIIMPSTDFLGLISFDTTSGFWTYTTVLLTASVGNLQAVLNLGNTAENTGSNSADLLLDDTETLYKFGVTEGFSVASFTVGIIRYIRMINAAGTGALQFFNPGGSTVENSIVVKSGGASTYRTQTLQDASGVIALTSQIASKLIITAGSGGYSIGTSVIANDRLTGPFFGSNTISEIVTDHASYITGVDFTQSTASITWINGNSWAATQVLIAKV